MNTKNINKIYKNHNNTTKYCNTFAFRLSATRSLFHKSINNSIMEITMICRKHKLGIDFEMVKEKRYADPRSLLKNFMKRYWKDNDLNLIDVERNVLS